jgi:hypothetical protein
MCSLSDVVSMIWSWYNRSYLQLPCALSDFPCKYLGIPLALKKLKKELVQHIIDIMANQLPGWKADLWETVCRPIEYGGLGISNLRNLNWALRARWLWLKKPERRHPWSALDILVPDQAHIFFSMAITSDVGNGEHTLFWTDRWHQGRSIADLAPLLYTDIPQVRRQCRTIQKALLNRAWIFDIQGALTIGMVVEYMQLWELLGDFELLKWRIHALEDQLLMDNTMLNRVMRTFLWVPPGP